MGIYSGKTKRRKKLTAAIEQGKRCQDSLVVTDVTDFWSPSGMYFLPKEETEAMPTAKEENKLPAKFMFDGFRIFATPTSPMEEEKR